MPLTDEQLSLLHDHFKESFTLIRDRERQRDRLFLWLLLLYAVLIIEIQYPANAQGALGTVTIAGNTIDLQLIPLFLLLDASWVFLAAFVLKYCQVATAVDRQYPYLHALEERISASLKDEDLYRREGRAYLTSYPRLLSWAWLCYTLVFPSALILATGYLYVVEAVALRYSPFSKAFDGLFAMGIVITVILYRYLQGGHPGPGANDEGGEELTTESKASAEGSQLQNGGGMSYLDEVASVISRELHESPSDATPPALLRLYAVLLLSKGDQVNADDVHNAWAAWMQETQPENVLIRPYRELDASTQGADDPFVEAIRLASRSLNRS